MNPIRLILAVEAASTCGGMLTDVAMSEHRDTIASMKTRNLLLAIRTYDCGRMLITLSNVGYLTIHSLRPEVQMAYALSELRCPGSSGTCPQFWIHLVQRCSPTLLLTSCARWCAL